MCVVGPSDTRTLDDVLENLPSDMHCHIAGKYSASLFSCSAHSTQRPF